MPTPAERSALLFVAAVAALGVGVRGCQGLRPPPAVAADRTALARQIAAVDSAVAAGAAARSSRRGGAASQPAERGRAAASGAERNSAGTPAAALAGPIDVDRATAEVLDVLPGIGPALAARIVADRDSLGPFGSLEGLQRVRGIGPALAAKLKSRITFSGVPRPAPPAPAPRARKGRPLHP